MKMRFIVTVAFCTLPFLTGACVKGVPISESKEKIFAALEKDGPQVEGVEATLLTSAKRASTQGEHEKAAQLYGQLLDMDKANQDYKLELADSFRHTGNYEGAEGLYDEILKETPDNLDAQEGKALTRMAMGEFDRAGKLLAEIHQKDKKRWRAMNALGILLVERGNHKDATAYFKQALKHKPNYSPILNNIGLNYAIQDDPENAINYLMRAADNASSKSPIKKNVELNLALVMGIFGDMQAAEKILKNHLPEAAVANNLGLYAYLANNQELAKGYLNTALSSSPYHYERAWKNLQTVSKQPVNDKKLKSSGAKVLKVE